MPKQKANLVRFTFRLPPRDKLAVDKSIENGIFLSQSQALRFITKRYLTERRMAENAIKFGTIPPSDRMNEIFRLPKQRQKSTVPSPA